MTFCLSYSCSCFNSFSYSISYSCFMNTSIHIAFPILFLFHAYSYGISYTCTVGCLCIHTSFMYSCPSMNLLFLEIGIIPIESSKLKLWHFHAKLVILPISHSGQFEIPIFQCLDSIFDTDSLYTFKSKVLWVLVQLESPKSKHRNSSYVLNNPDYPMFKNRTRNWLEHSPTLSDFLGNIESEFEGTYFMMFSLP